MSKKELKMSFDPNTIEHLGIKMYSNLPTAIAELIANAYDACSKHVRIRLYNNGEKKIIVEDDGTGMAFEEINSHFLRIGRNRRAEGEALTGCDRIATGKKGLGKLAFFGIGDTIEIVTRKNGKETTFTLDWTALKNTPDGQDYKPTYKIADIGKQEVGTIITISNLKRKMDFEVEDLANSLSKLFNFPDQNFHVYIALDDQGEIEIDAKLKYKNMDPEFEWKFPDFLQKTESDYEHKDDINGKVVTTAKPIRPGLRGITLFANGRMINLPEFFGSAESSHFFSYTTGWLDVDFVDNWEEDVISTNRQSVNWENEKTDLLRKALKKSLVEIEKDWHKRRKEKKEDRVQEKTKINISDWYSRLPSEIKEKIEPTVSTILENSELSENDFDQVVTTIHEFVPEYPYYHWRHLHPEIQSASLKDYVNQDYYRAFLEAAKRYINAARKKSGSNNTSEQSMMGEIFGNGSNKLSVTKKYKKPSGADFNNSTKENIEDGQKMLSMGIVAGGRNPVSHEEISDLRDSGLFTEKDCLDGLSLLSHLYKRLDDA